MNENTLVSTTAIARMQGILGDHVVPAADLVRAFSACTIGGLEYAWLILNHAIEHGLIKKDPGDDVSNVHRVSRTIIE